jgi:NAD(P)H-hydrate epimerase
MCGAGNNAGDGYVVARLAQQHGMNVKVVSLIDPEQLQADALQAYKQWAESSELSSSDVSLIDEADVIVDALLGTGLTRDVEADWKKWIDAVNYSKQPIIAIDVPSGLDAATGAIKGAAVRANITVSFIGLKAGLFTGSGKACCGEVIFNSLGVPEQIYENVEATAVLLDESVLAPISSPRSHNSHKSQYGHVLVIGGNYGMPGAVILAAKAALRSGTGMVSVVTREEHISAVAGAIPEAMVYASADGSLESKQLKALVSKITHIVIGPGLGQDAWAHRLFSHVMELDKPIVLDADALNLLAEKCSVDKHVNISAPHIITPHPGEAARLLSNELNIISADIQSDRFAAVQALYEMMDGVVVLKGSGTLVFDGESLAVCPLGNPAMAVAGMGDVLSGVIAALAAQGLSMSQAASIGVCMHAKAGDLAAEDITRGMLATDVIEKLPFATA